jgi:Lysyl oxidase
MVMRRPPLVLLLLSVSILACPAIVGMSGSALAQTTPTKFYPDVKPLQLTNTTNPVELEIDRSPSGKKRLHFAFKAEDVGAGPLEVIPKRQDCNHDGSTANDRTAYQHIYGDTNGNGVYDPPNTSDPAGPDGIVRTRKVGCFVFDPAHGHWHFQDYAKYRLLDASGTVVGVRPKVGFCLFDDSKVETLPGTPPAGYYNDRDHRCRVGQVQGISVGWQDVYGAFTQGQSISIQGLPNGLYCLVENADPKNLLRESDDSNNVARTQIDITRMSVSATGNPC